MTPPRHRKLGEPLDPDEVHQFLFPGHGWAAVADHKEAKELMPERAKALRRWRSKILAEPSLADADRLTALAAGVEALWNAAVDRMQFIQQEVRRHLDLYGATRAERPPVPASREQVEHLLKDPDSPLGRLRTLMDAWVGLWYWPLDADTEPPGWGQWLRVAEELVRPEECSGITSQMELFDDLGELLDAERHLQEDQVPVAELRELVPWLVVALDAAQREGAWHWELEFAPVFRRGGFDLQIGNPPWVRPAWQEDLVLAEGDPWWGVTGSTDEQKRRQRRRRLPGDEQAVSRYLGELSEHAATSGLLGSPLDWPRLVGIQTDLYLNFIDTALRWSGPCGIVGLLHPEGHFTDPQAGPLRRHVYRRLRRHFQFRNVLKPLRGSRLSKGIRCPRLRTASD